MSLFASITERDGSVTIGQCGGRVYEGPSGFLKKMHIRNSQLKRLSDYKIQGRKKGTFYFYNKLLYHPFLYIQIFKIVEN